MIETVNPVNGVVLQRYAAMSSARIEATVHDGAAAARDWGLVPVAERLRALHRLASVLRDRSEAPRP